MNTVRQDLEQATRLGMGPAGLPGADLLLPVLAELECRVWRKWDQLKGSSWILRAIAGTVEAKVLRPILGDRPAGCA